MTVIGIVVPASLGPAGTLSVPETAVPGLAVMGPMLNEARELSMAARAHHELCAGASAAPPASQPSSLCLLDIDELDVEDEHALGRAWWSAARVVGELPRDPEATGFAD